MDDRRRCHAVKKNGERCGNTQLPIPGTPLPPLDGWLCHLHRGWSA